MKIAIVNDMKLSVQMLKRIVQSEGYSVCWTACDGADAVKKCKEDKPDLILMDLIMPVMNGVEATRIIMEEMPCLILVVTCSVEANASLVFEAMGYGALDAVDTPALDGDGEIRGSDALLRKIELLTALDGSVGVRQKGEHRLQEKVPVGTREKPPLIVIGASTGGPLALVKVFKKLPKDHRFAIVVVQHIDEKFVHGLTQWLTVQTGQKVTLAREGGLPIAGEVHLAGMNHHLLLNSIGRYKYSEEPKERPYHPSIDVFFHSVAAHWGEEGVAIILTGMGSDGGSGMRALHDAGWFTIAQSEKTCIIFGMPRAAIEQKAVSCVGDVDNIADEAVAAAVFKRRVR